MINVTKLLVLFLALSSCSSQISSADYLQTVLNNLDAINSASYLSVKEAFAAGDTVPSVQMGHLVREFDNPSDTFIGACYVSLLRDDTTQMTFCYDGWMRAVAYEEERSIVIDSFSDSKLPFRSVSPPFFNYTESIIRYALETTDSISIDIRENRDEVYFCLTISEDRQVEFFGKAFYIDRDPFDAGDPTSKYEIWIDKVTGLPQKCRREMSHMTSVETVSNVRLNHLSLDDFHASAYFMPGWKISPRGTGEEPGKQSDMTGKAAPGWALENQGGTATTLSELKGKVVLVQFTSVTCGPCRASVPFLNELKSAQSGDDFTLVAIECTSRSLSALKSYRNRYSVQYDMLLADKRVLEDYRIVSYPVFFILDRDLIIRDVIKGYRAGTTDRELTALIEKMMR